MGKFKHHHYQRLSHNNKIGTDKNNHTGTEKNSSDGYKYIHNYFVSHTLLHAKFPNMLNIFVPLKNICRQLIQESVMNL